MIKANIPARMAFAVASSIDSRTVLDGSGAEKLVGRGDMLYLSPEVSKPKRVQGVFLSDKEINDVIRFIKSFGEADYEIEFNGNSSISSVGGGTTGFSDDDDPLLGEAMEIIRQSGKASASLLQRRLKLGYARAARILDLLEEREIIGPSDGAKPREVFLDKLGGVGAVQFASREHDLTGELRPIEDEEEEEPSFTAFNFEEVKSEEDHDEENPLINGEEIPEELENVPEIEELNEDSAEEDLLAEIDAIEEEVVEEDKLAQENSDEELIEEVVEEEVSDEEQNSDEIDESEEAVEELETETEEDEISDDKKDKKKKLFSEDEWT